MEWIVGMRCASIGEPALGLGIISEVGARNLGVVFPATGAEREYAAKKAPLRRVLFDAGDTVYDNNGNGFVVRDVKENNGLAFYLGETELLPETDLNHSIVFSKPHQKLLAGQVDKPHEFDLRASAWELKNKCLGSPCRGFIGARIELLPHQLYIAGDVALRHNPRVLLSDEVGLGKTIEAGLIFHQLWITGEVQRVLCLAPGSLITQWLTEFYRKFNVLFSIMTPTQAEELSKTHPDMNPYLSHRCVLQDLDKACEDHQLREWITDAEWDLVIVDEAHHLYWSEDNYSVQYELVEDLSKTCGGMLLLTATPRQLGLESHFGRLRLLDPDRFDSLEGFYAENEQYGAMADITERVLSGDGRGVKGEIAALFPDDHSLIEKAPDHENLTTEEQRSFCRELIDRHGTGRMVYRNHRKVLTGYPKRMVHPIKLTNNVSYRDFMQEALKLVRTRKGIAEKLLAGAPSFHPGDLDGKLQDNRKLLQKAWREDPRLKWLVPFLRQNPDDKFLFICSRKSVVLALQEWFGLTKDIDIAVFHEELTLLERDRQAAWFARPEGARVLICSEIGSEGRNFQFAHKLILFDLPINPALLEQRIGRLDRIGQRQDIDIYIPFIDNSPQQYLYRWHHEGLDAFEHHLLEGDYIFEHVKEDIFKFFDAVQDPEIMDPFIAKTRIFATELKNTIEKGRDRLLELNSFDPEVAEDQVESIKAMEGSVALKTFMDGIFELYGIAVEDQDQLQTQILHPTPQMTVESFPCLPEDGLEITYTREHAVAREDLAFLSFDHPMVTGAIDMILSMEKGATSFALWKGAPEPGILVQGVYIFECQGGDELRLGRFLPPIPIVIAVDQNKKLRPDLLEQLPMVRLEHGPVNKLHHQRGALTEIVESLLAVAAMEAEDISEDLRQEAEQSAMLELKVEYDRLKALMDINPSVKPEELDHIEERLNMIIENLEESQCRLDAVRLIMMIP